ncbi:MAG: stage III sporulation protein AF [Muricoprocola sp.]
MESWNEWLKSLVYCICILELLYHLVRNPHYQKYLRFFGGLVFLMTVLDPVLQMAREGDTFQINIWKEEMKEKTQELEEMRQSLAGMQNRQIEQAYQKELENQVREIVKKCEGKASKIQVYTDAEEEIPEVQRIVIIMEEGESGDVLLKETLEAIYHLPEERIEIRYET